MFPCLHHLDLQTIRVRRWLLDLSTLLQNIILSNSGPLTLMKLASDSVATAFASSVLPSVSCILIHILPVDSSTAVHFP